MTFNIQVTIPDDLKALLSILQNPEVKALAEDLDAEPVAAGYPPVTRDQLVKLACEVTKNAQRRDEARAIIAKTGFKQLADVPESLWPEVYVKLSKLMEKKYDNSES